MQLAVRGFHGGADVEPLTAAGRAGRFDERVDHVIDEHVVAGVRAVAEHPGGLAGQQGLSEDRDHPGLAVRVLARPVDVREGKGGELEPVQLAICDQVVDGRLLRHAVGRQWPVRLTLVDRQVGGLRLAEDCRRIEAVLDVLGGRASLAVDANGKFERVEALAYAKALRPFGLKWFEEPCHPLDFALYAEIAATYDAPLATGENLYSTQDVENLVRFGGLRTGRDFIQVDPPQAYGIAQYAKTVAMLEGRGWSRASLFPHGGNQMSLAIAAGFGLGGAESYPGVFGSFGGFADDAAVENGFLPLSDRPGIGFEGQAALYALMRPLVE